MASSIPTVHLPLCFFLLLLLIFFFSFYHGCVAQEALLFRLGSSRGFRGGGGDEQEAGLRRCRFEKLAALEPSRQVRSEAGFAEYYNAEARDDFRCAGLSVRRLVVDSMGLALPAYANGPKLVYIVQGRGVFGIAMPGCPATYQWVQSPLEQQMAEEADEGQSSQRLKDEHQKIQQFRQGDIIAVPAGVTHWLYNHGDSPVIAFTVFDTVSTANQLDPSRRDFFLAGKPRRSGEQPYAYEAAEAQNVFAGFSTELLAESLGVSRQVAARLQSQSDRRGEVVRVERGLRALQPSFQGEPLRDREPEEESYSPEEEPTAAWSSWAASARQRNRNGAALDLDTMCAMKFRRNIDSPRSSDVFNPRGGRITRANSQNFPILDVVQMSATRTVLQNNALMAPHWTVNAHTVVYVTAGQGRVQVADSRGRSVFDGELRQAQVLLVPQGFAVAVKARREGFAWVSIKTNPSAVDSQVAGKASVLRALPLGVVANAYRLSREEARSLKFSRADEAAVFAPRQAYAAAAEYDQ